MRVELHGVGKGLALPPADVTYASGEAVLAIAETEQRPTVLGLIASGRMVPDTGMVRIDGSEDDTALRRRVALVDAPPVCDPEPNVTVTGVTVEELMFAGRPSTVPAARRWLTEHGFAHLARTPIGDLAPHDRIALLMQLTAMRPEVEGLVLVSPDRHRGEPAEWWDIAQQFAADDYAVLVVAGAASARVLGLLPDPEADEPEQQEPDQQEPEPQEPVVEPAADDPEPDAQTAEVEPPTPVVERARPEAERDETQSDETQSTERFDSPPARTTTEAVAEPDAETDEEGER